MKLYRYMKLDAAINTLKTGMLRLGQIQNFNDPFDCLFAFKSKNLPVPQDFFSPFSQRFRNQEFSKYGILCFSSKGTTPAMWAHYADGTKGVCFECELQEDESLIKIQYNDDRLIFDISDEFYLDSQKCRDDVIEIIKRKHSCWEYEDEYRVFLKLGEGKVIKRGSRRSAYNSTSYSFLPIESDMIKKIIIGPLASEGSRNKIVSITSRSKFKNVKIVQAKIHPAKYEVDIG
jgi:hypothetical protein